MSKAETMRATLAAGLLAAIAAPVNAQTPASPNPLAIVPDSRELRSDAARARSPEALFAVFDADENGCIDDSEWRRRIMAVFFVLDTEGTDSVTGIAGDGQLTRAEAPNLKDDLFLAADANGDGSISGFEFNQASFTRYEAAKKQQPRCVSFGEFSAYLQTLRTGMF